jgi:hypothetical protein
MGAPLSHNTVRATVTVYKEANAVLLVVPYCQLVQIDEGNSVMYTERIFETEHLGQVQSTARQTIPNCHTSSVDFKLYSYIHTTDALSLKG